MPLAPRPSLSPINLPSALLRHLPTPTRSDPNSLDMGLHTHVAPARTSHARLLARLCHIECRHSSPPFAKTNPTALFRRVLRGREHLAEGRQAAAKGRLTERRGVRGHRRQEVRRRRPVLCLSTAFALPLLFFSSGFSLALLCHSLCLSSGFPLPFLCLSSDAPPPPGTTAPSACSSRPTANSKNSSCRSATPQAPALLNPCPLS